MLVSVDWLRTICPFEQDAARAASALTARGLTVDSVERAGDDTVFEIDVPANRPDCLGHLGVARELAAAFGVPLVPPPDAPADRGEPVDRVVAVQIDDAELCPRYTARVVRGVRVGPSPRWVVDRLEACGLRSINNVVDASNLVLLELGNPIHFFDLSLMRDARIVVRRAKSGEQLATLDGVERKLDADMLMIADGQRAVALAGVIGGADTEIRSSTRDVLVEAAYFEPRSIRSTARKLGLKTDASHRFERGVDPEGVVAAQAMACRLLVELAGGVPAPGMIDAHPRPIARPAVTLRPDRIPALVGYRPSDDEIRDALERLHLKPEPRGDGTVQVRAPSWRVDLEREADVVEEVARHLGYDRIPGDVIRPSTGPAIEPARRMLELEERARDLLAHLGFHEAFSYAMVGAGEDDPFVASDAPAALPLTNPIAETMAVLRRSIAPGLVRAADLNLRRGSADVRLFEVGRVFLGRGAGVFPAEPLRAGIVWCGGAWPAHWNAVGREAGYHDLAGVVEYLLGALRPGVRPVREPGGPPGLHPGRSSSWRLPSGAPLGWAGALHPDVRHRLDLPAEVLLAEIELEEVGASESGPAQCRPVPRVPAVSRDLSLVVRRDLAFERLRALIEQVPSPAPASLEVIDRYEGPPLEATEVSLTVRLTLQPLDRTLTDSETEAYRADVVRALAEHLDIRLRG